VGRPAIVSRPARASRRHPLSPNAHAGARLPPPANREPPAVARQSTARGAPGSVEQPGGLRSAQRLWEEGSGRVTRQPDCPTPNPVSTSGRPVSRFSAHDQSAMGTLEPRRERSIPCGCTSDRAICSAGMPTEHDKGNFPCRSLRTRRHAPGPRTELAGDEACELIKGAASSRTSEVEHSANAAWRIFCGEPYGPERVSRGPPVSSGACFWR